MEKGEREFRDTRWHWSNEDDELLKIILLMTEGEKVDPSSN